MTSPLARSRACYDSRLLGAYLDGELDASSLLDVETHLAACETCRERVEVDRATRQSLKRVVHRSSMEAGTSGLAALRSRAMTAMMAERARSDARAFAAEERSKLMSWRTMVPLATAAAFALFWGAASRGPVSDSTLGHNDSMRAGFANDDFLNDLLDVHRRPVPPQWTSVQDVRALDQYVGVPVRPLPFERGGASLVGASLVPVHQQRAAMLQYVIGSGASQSRVSIFIYDPNKIQILGPDLARREVGHAEVRVGQENGYSVAVTQKRGVGYALASDLDPDRSAQLAALAVGE